MDKEQRRREKSPAELELNRQGLDKWSKSLEQEASEISKDKQFLEDEKQIHEQQRHKLKKLEESLGQRESTLTEAQKKLSTRELVFDDQKQKLEHKQDELLKREALLKRREDSLAQQQTAMSERGLELDARHRDQEQRQYELEQGLPALRESFFAEREQQLAELKDQLNKKASDLSAHERDLQSERQRLGQIQEAVDNDFADQRSNLQRELQQARSASIASLHNEIDQKRQQEFKTLEQELLQRRSDLAQQEQNMEQDQANLKAAQNKLRHDQTEVKALQASLEQKIEERTQTRLEAFEQDQQLFEQDKQRLLVRIEQQDKLHSSFDELKRALGDRSAEEILKELTAKNEELIELRKKLERPSQELEEYYDQHRAEVARLEQANEQQQNEIRDLQNTLDSQEQLEYDQERLQRKFDSLDANHQAVLADNNKLKETLERLSPAYNEPQSLELRIREIKRPYIADYTPRRQEKINELSWLEEIRSGISNHGLQFSHRILCAFHTALKIAEWSPLTVLAGVSGTGKSELPKLYSRFGGINFINVPVQPNWDSQESMLGYFNSISNSYEAQPMLNFLVQSREKLVKDSDDKDNNYNGLDDTVSLVLLDEMNLAHVELYFADFLSKLEQRRATKKDELPSIDINLGAKLDPYKLSLGRNLLFAGTMNQDETTKSLSDKVIDRGTSIYFPRPNALHRREKLKPLPKQSDLLPLNTWKNWIKTGSDLSKSSVGKYKTLIENINHCLGADGRALGHRVWQSIEYYMVNHPLVLALNPEQHPDEYKDALRFAFEDQLVQKVMPKLRGIETRGYAKEHCLNPIRQLLADEKLDILEDFDKAMRIGHGQFSWSSADYLNNDQSNERYQELFELAINTSTGQSASSNNNADTGEAASGANSQKADKTAEKPSASEQSASSSKSGKVPEFFKKKLK